MNLCLTHWSSYDLPWYNSTLYSKTVTRIDKQTYTTCIYNKTCRIYQAHTWRFMYLSTIAQMHKTVNQQTTHKHSYTHPHPQTNTHTRMSTVKWKGELACWTWQVASSHEVLLVSWMRLNWEQVHERTTQSGCMHMYNNTCHWVWISSYTVSITQ